MTDDEYEISEEPPRDEQGHPIHPERGHRICGATKSDRTTPTDHGRERDEYDYCLLAAGWGTDRQVGPCSKHPVTGEQWGESNPSYKHGGYSRYLSEANYTEGEKRRAQAVADDLDDPDERDSVFRSLISDLWVRWDRTKDPRYARELRQMMSDFGYTPEDARELHVEHSGSVDHDHTHELDDRQRAQLDAITDGPAEIDVETLEDA